MKNSLILAGAVLAFATAGSAQILSEDFNADLVPPAGWTEINNGNDLGWEPDYYGAATHADYYGWNDNHLMTPVMDFTGHSDVVAEFDQNQIYASWRYSNTVEISLDGGLSFAVVYDETGASSGVTTVAVDLGAYDGMADVSLSFHYQGDYANRWNIDQLDVGAATPWPPPGAFFGEDFNAGTPPAGWSETNNGNSAGWEDGGGRAWHDDYTGWNDNILVSPAIDMSSAATPGVHFVNVQTYASWRYANTVEATQDGGLTWDVLYTEDTATSGTEDTEFDMVGYGGSTGTQLGFRYTGDYANEWSIDDLYIDDHGLGGPAYTITNLVAGQTCVLEVTGCDPSSSVIFAYSVAGPGPSTTIFGDVDMSAPIKRIGSAVACDSAGTASVSRYIPAGAAGIMIYSQCAEFVATGVGNLTNSHAVAIQ